MLTSYLIASIIQVKSLAMIKQINWACCYSCSSDNVTVETTIEKPGWAMDGDTLLCLDCGEIGSVSCDGEGGAIDNWKAEEEDYEPLIK